MTRKLTPRRIGYKVVHASSPNILASAHVHLWEWLNVNYAVGKITRPNLEHTFLFAFRDLDKAKDYVFKPSYKIFKAECFSCYEDGALDAIVNLDDLKLFFSNRAKELWCYTENMGVTFLCKSIRLLEEIKV